MLIFSKLLFFFFKIDKKLKEREKEIKGMWENLELSNKK
jgi:hypothetical protein